MSARSSFSQENNVKFVQMQVKQFREEMNKIKSPFLQKIKASTQTFQSKIKAFQQKLNHESREDAESNQQLLTQSSKYNQKQLDTEQNINQKQHQEGMNTLRETESERNLKKDQKSQLPLHLMQEWRGNSQYAFDTVQEVKENFVNVFTKKLGVNKKKKKIEKSYDFKDDETTMLTKIYHQLQNSYGPDKGFVNIDRIIEFFQQNQLFYLFYNIHPNQLKYILKDSARTKPDSLTKKEFLYIFIMDRPLLKDLSDPYEKIVHRKCILDTEGWQQLKNIFNTLDTFGNQTIHIRSFFQKLKAYHSNPNLIFTPVIQFPQIQRVYTLKKVVFDLQHKFNFSDKIEWKDIQELILKFNHKEEPTLDIIFENHLEQATIMLDSNYFLIEKKVIALLKHIFEKCPKFSDFFVNTKFLCNELIENQDLKLFLKNPVRSKTNIYGGYISMEEAIRSMVSKAPRYIDLDEFLEYFSIKGTITNVLLQIHDSNETSDAEQEAHYDRKKMLRKIRSLQRLEKSRKQKKTKRTVKKVTDFQEFNLTKKQRETIRQKKVKEMIKEKEQNEDKQLKMKFKANPIPADLNPERLKEQQKRKQNLRKKKIEEIAKRKQQEKQLMSYLRANTRLFEPLKKQTNEDKLQANTMAKSQTVHFNHKPVPWFVQENLLDKIEREKSERKKKIYEEARLKYVRSWNQLPDFFFKNEELQQSAEQSIIQELENMNSKPKIVIKATPVPDFKSLHKEFKEQLDRKKQSFQPTKIQEFKLTSPKVDKRQFHSQYVSPNNKNKSNSRWREALHSPPPQKISTTKKTEEWMEHNKKVQEERRAIQEEEREKERERIAKQKNFAKYMSKKLRQKDKNMPNLMAQTAQKLNKHKQTVQYFEKLTEHQLSQMYARVLQRPFLFQVPSGQKQNRKQGNKGKNEKKLKKKGVIKHIEPIDMSEGSTNNKYGNSNDEYEYNPYAEKNQDNSYSQQEHEALNQSF